MSNADLDIPSADLARAAPTEAALQHARTSLVLTLPEAGLGFDNIRNHILEDIAPGFTGPTHLSQKLHLDTSGGVTDAALFADWLVSTVDQNVQVHLPRETIATTLESTTLRLLQQLLSLNETDFPGRTFTTGAAASNVLGMALGREFVVAEAGRRTSPPVHASVAELGLLEACLEAGVQNIQIVTTKPQASLYKAASAAGIGRDSVILVPLSEDEPWKFDMDALAQHLSRQDVKTIIVVGAAEADSGRFVTHAAEMAQIRRLADEYGAWVHVDGSFGIRALILPHTSNYSALNDAVSTIHLADSIAGDAHEFNVPHDCGFFFTRHLDLQQTVFRNPGAAYLSTATVSIPSPLNLGLENSRRFRALPVYASLLAYGRIWYCALLERQIALAHRIAVYISKSPLYELIPNNDVDKIYTVVLFRARSESLDVEFASRLEAPKQIHISGLTWNGRPAARIAVGTWGVEVDGHFERIVDALRSVSPSD
ncbi:pyridoxal-dependent decarboxylase [Mycena filopes]|nr:pyridoxal-dependent decarboxylase [Mycena filopes]